MAERIYNKTETGSLDPLLEERFSNEDELQALIAEHPELLDGEQIRPGDPRRWLLITREKGIADSSESGARWSVDHLIVDQDAVPTLVEVKRGSNSEIRRTIVGQMLDYAANAPQTWTAEELRQTFEETASQDGVDPDEKLRELLETDDEADCDQFWEKVETNLTAQKMRLLFVADEIPDELERIVMFLNAQMPNVEVLAVEIKQFKGQSSQTLVPRVIGRVANVTASRSSATRQRLTLATFLDGFADQDSRTVAEVLLNEAVKSGAELEWGPSGVSVRAPCTSWRQPVTVAWFYTPSTTNFGWMKTRDFSFGTGILEYDPGPDQPLRQILERWAKQFSQDDFTLDASSKGVDAWSVDYQAAVKHANVLVDRLRNVITEIRSL